MAVDMFLKLTGITGESKDQKHKDEIQIDSFTFGMTQLGSSSFGGGGGTGKVSVNEIGITKIVDKASCALMYHCCSGKHIPEGIITVRKAGDQPLEYLKIKLTEVVVTGVQHNGAAGTDLVVETVALNFAKFKVEYQEQKSDGSGSPAGELGWDLKANAKY
jgi:type VI secretion system secreted protein Hcp